MWEERYNSRNESIFGTEVQSLKHVGQRWKLLKPRGNFLLVVTEQNEKNSQREGSGRKMGFFSCLKALSPRPELGEGKGEMRLH